MFIFYLSKDKYRILLFLITIEKYDDDMAGNGNMADTNTYVIKFEEKGLPIEKIGGKALNLGKCHLM